MYLNREDSQPTRSICFDNARTTRIPNRASAVLMNRDPNCLVLKSIVGGKYQTRTISVIPEINNVRMISKREMYSLPLNSYPKTKKNPLTNTISKLKGSPNMMKSLPGRLNSNGQKRVMPSTPATYITDKITQRSRNRRVRWTALIKI